jgi:hypothetical protein
MCKKYVCLISLILMLTLAGNALAVDRNWTNGNGNRAWGTAANWDTGVPTTADKAAIRNQAILGPIIAAGTNAVANQVVVGDWGSTSDSLTITGGSLTTSGTNPWIILGYGASNNGTLIVSGGTINAGGNLYAGFSGTGTIDMTGGVVNVTGTLGIAQQAGSTGDLFLDGGTISCGSLNMTSGGAIDITAGTLIVNGDARTTINGYISSAWITAYGGAGSLNVDYNVSNPGKTTVTATTGGPPAKATSPNPANSATGIGITTDLSWTAGDGTDSHDVYFGTTSPGAFQGNQTGTTFDTGTMANSTTYYWRIDEKNAAGTTTGDVWSFTTAAAGLSDTTDDGLGTITANGDNPPNETVAEAFDNTSATKWLDFSPSGSWIQYQYASSKVSVVTQYTLTSANDYEQRDPTNWNILGSNNGGASWTTLDTRSGELFTARFQTRSFSFSNSTAYNIYRLEITQLRGGTPVPNSVQLAEIELIGTTPVPPGPTPPSAATNPNPANSATGVAITATLSWTAGAGATSHDVYFGTSSPGTFRGNQSGTTYNPGSLAYNTTYYWRINEVNASGTTTGTVWSFTTASAPQPPAKATGPSPANSATNVGVTTDLGWTAGTGATSHDVYFGTTSPGTFRGNQTGTTYDTGTMANSTTYYWRIDEKNAVGTTTGDVWSFTTAAAGLSDTTDDGLGTITARGENLPDEGMAKAFDNSTATKWLDFSPTSSWIQYQYASGNRAVVTQYTLTSANDAQERDPTNWNLLGSNNGGASWTTLDTRTGVLFTARFQKLSFSFSNSTGYNIYRLSITQLRGPTPNSVQLAEIELIGTPPEPPAPEPPSAATNPSPASGATNVDIATDLAWTAGSGATSHDVYFGTSSPGTFQGNQAGTTFDTGVMANNTTYYWRIDEKNAYGTTTGSVWSFTTAPVAPGVDRSWTNGAGTRAWGTATNWDTGVPNSADKAAVRNTAVSGPIIAAGTNAVANVVVVGDWSSTNDTIDMTGGSLTTGSWFVLGYGPTSNHGTFTMSGGVVNVGSYMYVGNTGTSVGVLAMSGGTINVTGVFGIAQVSTSIGDVFLDGGTISCGSLNMTSGGAMDITTGTLIVNGDARTTINGYVSSAWITAYGGAGTVNVSYNTPNAGKTTVTGTPSTNPPSKATNPNPSNGASGVGIATDLSWSAGPGATSHDVYFGTSSPGAFQGNQAGTTFDTGTMAYNTTYYWRINEKNAYGTTTGDIWHFTTGGAVTANRRKGPYLLYPGNNTQMTVLWQIDVTTSCNIAWGTSTSYSTGNANTSEYGSDHQHKYNITGLTPGTHYYYRVTAGSNNWTGNFYAAPASSATSVKFFMYGDTRTNGGSNNTVCGQMISAYNSDAAYQTMVLHSGDWVESNSESTWTSQWYNYSWTNIVNATANMPFMGCIGNHESNGSVFEKYHPYSFVAAPADYFSFDYGPVHIAVVDQYTSYTSGSAQYNWLVNDLSSTSKQWKIIVLHEPGWSCGGGHSNNTTVQNTIQPLCTQYGVDIVVAGHNHYYSRAVVSGVHHLTDGGGGAPLYTPSSGANIVTYTKTICVSKVAISGNSMTCTTVNGSGSVIDTFTVNH